MVNNNICINSLLYTKYKIYINIDWSKSLTFQHLSKVFTWLTYYIYIYSIVCNVRIVLTTTCRLSLFVVQVSFTDMYNNIIVYIIA